MKCGALPETFRGNQLLDQPLMRLVDREKPASIDDANGVLDRVHRTPTN